MDTTAQRWGNSLAIRIPAAVARETHIKDGTQVHLELDAGKIILTPKGSRVRFDLNALLAQVTARNLPDADVWGTAVGKEAW